MFQFKDPWLRRYLRQIRLELTGKGSPKVTIRTPTNHDSLQVDGQVDDWPSSMPLRRRRVAGDVCAIFVHAGAGFHSVQNERVHLEACEDAARSAMAFLNNGGAAIDAVEIAIKVLEDKEITNAGWGSNLAIDGTVECDATVVDHYGRSGAVGAVGQIRNPIHLARLILEHSAKPLSLKRVPPNLLVGSGAIDFAFEHGIPIMPNDDLVSEAAQSRWLKWRSDLRKAEFDQELSMADTSSTREVELASCWNESQPYSPQLIAEDSATEDCDASQGLSNATKRSIGVDGQGHRSDTREFVADDDEKSFIDDNLPWSRNDTAHGSVSIDDRITDTVGAIAVDCLGNIAAGSSSGGIGMKHKGRVGPAGLVNVGTAVIPIEVHDSKKTCVASVTSGTGEHMATTLAASLCASRIYSGTRRTRDGGQEPIDDDGAMKAFVEKDFMGHPGVLHSHSPGAIGVLCVKKTVDGVWVYFGHNTDSFAVASMSSDDAKPRSTMSRNNGNNKVITGARAIKFRPAFAWVGTNPATWPSNPDSSLNPPSSAEQTQGTKRQKTRRVPSSTCQSPVPQLPLHL